MSEPLGIVRSYEDLRAVLARVRDIRNISCEEIDRLAGWPAGLAGKVLCADPTRNLGAQTIAGGLGALGVMLIAVDDPEALAKYTARATERQTNHVRNGAKHTAAVHVKIKPRFLKKIGAIGGKNSRKYISRRKASALGRKAARARWWKKPKAHHGPAA